MNRRQRIQYTVLILTGLLALFAFAVLWFNPANIPHNFSGPLRILDVALFVVVSYVIWLPIFMKVLTFAVASHIKKPTRLYPAEGMKVAFITTFVPGSESTSLLHTTLPAMISADYPHDVWLLDEGNDPEVRAICKQYGVNHFSRSGIDRYNATSGKFTRKTKGGNHNSWYDTVGNDYEFVAQIDTDFIPVKHFLTRTLGYFRDQKVAFVGTPQIYGNDDHSLIARGAAQQTYTFYGPLLRGMAGMDTTLLIGANHIIRVSALKEVDHYSAHITEDLLTGMKLHAKGYTSVYIPEALAIGEGPTTWKAYFTQQNRWAYGCIHILFHHSFRLLRTMTVRRLMYYFAIQQYYFSGLAMGAGVGLLVLYFLTGIQPMQLDLGNFIGSYVGIATSIFFIELWLQRFNIRPAKERGIMWAGLYVCIAVWPVFLMAFLDVFRRERTVFKVTPKGIKVKKQPLPIVQFLPHLVLGLTAYGGLSSSLITHRDSSIMVFWAIVCGSLLLFVPLLPLGKPFAQRVRRMFRKPRVIVSAEIPIS